MKYRILLTGKNKAVIDDFFYVMSNELECQTVSDRQEDVISHQQYFKPHAYVYCMGEEYRENMTRVIASMRKMERDNVEFMVIGNKEECEEFYKMAGDTLKLIIPKPFTAASIEKAILNYFDEIEKEEEEETIKEQEREDKRKKKLEKMQDQIDPRTRELKEKKEREKQEQKLREQQIEEAKERKAQELKRRKELEGNAVSEEERVAYAKAAAAAAKAEREREEHAAAGENSAKAVSAQKPAAKTEGYKRHVLVIDDDPRMLRLIKEELHENYDVGTAINGKLAMKFLETRHTDLVLLDYEMPVENGPMVLEKIRANEATKNLPVIFLTGINDREKIQTALSMRPQGYLLKPIDHEKLYAAIKNVIGA